MPIKDGLKIITKQKMDSQAKITISINEGKFEISGSELFVTQQIENFKAIIEKNLLNYKEHSPQGNDNAVENQSIQHAKPEQKTAEEKDLTALYPHIYQIDSDKVNIICDIPGNNDSKKTANAALLYAYAQKLRGINESNVEEIRDICKVHACFDQSNFSSYIKNGHPKKYLDKGTGKDRVISLTHPGEKAAIELLNSLKE